MLFRSPARRIAFFEDLQQRLAALPGVKTAAAIYNLPLRGDWWSQAFYLENEPEELSTQRPAGTMRIVTPGYFRAMEIPVLLGRDFNPTDQRTSQPVVIIDESFARRYFPDENPLGRRVKVSNRPDVWWEIVGVARDANHYGLLSERTQSGFYFPYIQQPSFAMTIVLKAEKSGTPGLLTAAQNEVRRLNRDVLVESPRLMQDVMARAYWQISLLGKLLAGFAALALVLAAVGIGAVASYTVSQRTHEIGVRLALGATKREVVRLVLKDGFRLALAGTGIGLLATWGLLRAFQSELYGVSAANPGQYLLLALVLGIVVLTACYLPARRAAKVDPLVALRYE